MSAEDHYAALGLGPDASLEEIRAAWRRIARADHPDVRPGDQEAAERFRRARTAHAVLTDAEARRDYDADRVEPAPPPPKKRSGLWRTLNATPGADLKLRLPLGLREQARGAVRTVGVERTEECDACEGAGCGACARSGRRPVRRRVEVRIPAGVRPGTRLRVAGEGDGGRSGGPNGDLLVTVESDPEEAWIQRTGDDLVVEIPVRISEVLLGGRFQIPTLDGLEPVDVNPGFDPTRPQRLVGRGMPRRGGGRGDVVIAWRLDLPSPPPTQQQDWARSFAEIETDSQDRQRLAARLSRWGDVDG